MKVSNKKLKEIYHLMKRSRAFEERAVMEYRKGRIPGFVHTSIGQEAISSGVCGLLEKDDYVLSTHRGHSDIISKGAEFDKMMAELFARQTGYCKGKGGSMHIIAPECNVLGCSGIIGATVPWASGVALACKMKKWDRVTVCFIGDGTIFQGAFHEGINIAAAFDLSVIFVCQNNQYAISTYWKDYTKLPNIAARAKGYGIPGISVDGMDAKAVAEVAGDAIEKARKGEGPTFIEGVTYRYHGHGQYDPGTTYRTKEEVEEWKKKDPINKLYSLLLNKKLITEKENQEFEERLSLELDEAVEFALKSPEPRIEEACTDIYCEDL